MKVYISQTLNDFGGLIAYHVEVVNQAGYIIEDHYYDAVFSRILGWTRAKHAARRLAFEYNADIIW